MNNPVPSLPALPPLDHFALAKKVMETTSESSATLDTLPAAARESLAYFNHVAQLATRIETDQRALLAGHHDAFVGTLVASGNFGPDAAVQVVSELFSSYAMAALLADVAAGHVVPLAGHGPSGEPLNVTQPVRQPAAQRSPAGTAPAEPRKRGAAAPAAKKAHRHHSDLPHPGLLDPRGRNQRRSDR